MARKITYDQEKVKELRMKIIEDSLLVFNDDGRKNKKIEKWTQFRKDLLMKYAPRVLPTLIAGKDDDSDLIPKPLLGGQSNVKNPNNKGNKKTAQAEGKD